MPLHLPYPRYHTCLWPHFPSYLPLSPLVPSFAFGLPTCIIAHSQRLFALTRVLYSPISTFTQRFRIPSHGSSLFAPGNRSVALFLSLTLFLPFAYLLSLQTNVKVSTAFMFRHRPKSLRNILPFLIIFISLSLSKVSICLYFFQSAFARFHNIVVHNSQS